MTSDRNRKQQVRALMERSPLHPTYQQAQRMLDNAETQEQYVPPFWRREQYADIFETHLPRIAEALWDMQNDIPGLPKDYTTITTAAAKASRAASEEFPPVDTMPVADFDQRVADRTAAALTRFLRTVETLDDSAHAWKGSGFENSPVAWRLALSIWLYSMTGLWFGVRGDGALAPTDEDSGKEIDEDLLHLLVHEFCSFVPSEVAYILLWTCRAPYAVEGHNSNVYGLGESGAEYGLTVGGGVTVSVDGAQSSAFFDGFAVWSDAGLSWPTHTAEELLSPR